MTTAQKAGTRRTVPSSKLHQSSFHRRTVWGDLRALADSIATVGMIHDPVVRPHPTIPGEWEMVAGERRRRACNLLEYAEIPVLIVELDDVAAIDWQCRENLDRADLHPIDEAEYYADLVQRGFDPGDIAKRFGRTRVLVKRRLALMSLTASARQAYAKGEIGHESALSLATIIGDPGRQDDVIAAVQSGSLQDEEIPSYVRREFSAPLDDVPWRLSDAEMPGGSCVNCPKRSQVQRDLFANLDDKAKDRCLDVTCWNAKMAKIWDQHTAEPAYTKSEEDTAALFIPQTSGRPAVMRSSGMVDAQASCPLLTGYTWEEAIRNSLPKDGESPTVYLAKDQDGRPRLLYRESIVTKIVRKSDAGKEAERIANAGDPSKNEEAGQKRAEARVRRAIVDQIVARVTEGDVDAWGWIVEQLMYLVSTKSVAAALSQYELASSDDLAAHVRDASNRKRKQIALTMLVREVADSDGGIPDALKQLCSIASVDLQAIETSIRKDAAE